jgi:hypothetical protein
VPISIDDSTSNIFAGGGGSDGDLVLRNNDGQDRIHLDAGGGNAWVGGNGADGDIVLFRSGSANGDSALASIHLDGQAANITAGGQGADGDLVLRNGSGQDVIHLDGGGGNAWLGGNGADGDVVLQASDGADRIRLDAGGGNLWIGGNGADGDIVLFPSSGDNATLSQATIHLDGQSGDIILQNADCAEDFEVAEDEAAQMEPGTAVVLGDGSRLRMCRREYDQRVVGIVAGACGNRPGIILGRIRSDSRRLPVALMGRVFCKADASGGPIEVGSLLTTSSTPGHVMRAVDPVKAFGAVVGKALSPLDSGSGYVQVLVALQ